MKLTLAPIPFYWPKQTVLDFYQQAQSWPVDRICLGETVCSKRREMRTEDWLDIARQLQAAGKEVAISTLALVEAESELKAIRSLCEQSDITVEANDLSAAEYLYQNGKAFTGGPFLNIYNVETLKLLAQDGLSRWTLPVELGQKELSDLLADIKREQLNIKTEVMVHGYLPLALSARCFTARAVDRPKDACKKVCIEYPTGIPVDSREDQRLFNLNGIQTQSGLILDLLAELPTLADMGVDAVRVVPSQPDMSEIIHTYARALSGETGLASPASSASYCNGYWYGKEGMASL
ncbi:U32 family peptidase [Reinekea marinisedimentorum]|uniref:Ubiquinone biosynthesis protein UbiV n=1 Tax=Reinekea marinisedimentorum TaxID=230495 RepID=A0A4R3HZ49_9GAMM|nr:U32 family peptidase [Reinekea marinisedimentorum]TCS38154.1 collagenase-like PrtC family protease [Reinekea marinisedimentorum]